MVLNPFEYQSSSLNNLVNLLKQEREKKQAEAEADAKRRTFRWESLLPALIAAPFTGGASLVSMGLPAAIGEGARAATGSDLDLGSLASATFQQFAPQRPLNVPPSASATSASATSASATSALAAPPSLSSLSKGMGMPNKPIGREPLDLRSQLGDLLQNQSLRVPQQPQQPNILEQLGSFIQSNLYKTENPQELNQRELMEKLIGSGAVEPGSFSREGVNWVRKEKDILKEYEAKQKIEQKYKTQKPTTVNLSNLSEAGQLSYNGVMNIIKQKGDNGIQEAIRELNKVTDISQAEKNFILSKIPTKKANKLVTKKQRLLE